MRSRRSASWFTRWLVTQQIAGLIFLNPAFVRASAVPAATTNLSNAIAAPLMPDPVFPASVPAGYAETQKRLDSACDAALKNAKALNLTSAALSGLPSSSSGALKALKAVACSGLVTDSCLPNAGGGADGQSGSSNMMGMMGMMGVGGGGVESCANYTNPLSYEKMLKQMEMFEMQENIQTCIAQCKLSKVAVGIAQLSCMNNKLQAMMDSMRSLSKQFTANTTGLEKLSTDVTNRLADIQSQSDDVKNRLDGTGGTPGINQTVDSLNTYINAIPDTLQSMTQQIKSNEGLAKTIDILKSSTLMVAVKDCFKSTKIPGLKCTIDGDDVSEYEYDICFSQRSQQQVGTNGQVIVGGILSKQIGAKVNTVTNVQDNLLSLIAQKPGDAAALSDVADASQYLLTNLPPPINSSAAQGLAYCGQLEQNIVSDDTNIFDQEKQLQASETAVINTVNAKVGEIGQTYGQAQASLTGTQKSLDMSACQTGSPSARVSCISNAVPALKAVLQTQTFSGTLRGTGSTPPLSFSCQGLTGCQAALGQLGNSLTTATTTYSTFQSNIGTKSLQAAQQTVASLGATYAQTNQQLLANYNTAMAGMSDLGIGFSANPLGSIGAEALQLGGNDNTLQPPQNILAVIGGDSSMSPGMIDQSSLLAARNQLTQAQQTLLQQMPSPMQQMQIAQMKSQIETKRTQCLAQSNRVAVKNAAELARALGAANCKNAISDCESHNNSMNNLLSVVNGLKTNAAAGFHREDLNVLKDGIRRICSDSTSANLKYVQYEDSETVSSGGGSTMMMMGGMGGMNGMNGMGMMPGMMNQDIFSSGNSKAQGGRLEKGETGTIDCSQINDLVNKVQEVHSRHGESGAHSGIAK